MTLQEQVNKDIVQAMKSKEQDKLDALRYLKSLFLQNNTAAKPTDDLSIAIAHAKKLQDSLESYAAGTPAHEKILNEINIIKSYLPTPLTEEEVVSIIQEIKKNGAQQFSDVMKELQGKIKGRFDGKKASELAKASFN